MNKMKMKSGFLTVIATAVITTGILFAAIGKPKYFSKSYFKTECSKVCNTENKSK